MNEVISSLIAKAKEIGTLDSGLVSDGCHTFDELYAHRKMYNAVLFNLWAEQEKYHVHKSRRHNDGLLCFGSKKWFIVVAMLPTGQITNHYKMEDWDLFNIPETPKALFPFDGHTTQDVLARLEYVARSEDD